MSTAWRSSPARELRLCLQHSFSTPELYVFAPSFLQMSAQAMSLAVGVRWFTDSTENKLALRLCKLGPSRGQFYGRILTTYSMAFRRTESAKKAGQLSTALQCRPASQAITRHFRIPSPARQPGIHDPRSTVVNCSLAAEAVIGPVESPGPVAAPRMTRRV